MTVSPEYLDDAALIERCASLLHQAERTRQTIAPLTDTGYQLTQPLAYRIQAAGIERRGAPRRGFKLGYTSAAMRAQMKIDQPNFGLLTQDHWRVGAGGLLESTALIHPLAEPEIALVLDRPLQGPGVSRLDAWNAVETVVPAIEIVDTRYHDYRFTLLDNIADNSSGARIVLGTPMARDEAGNLCEISVQLRSRGRLLACGAGAEALGDPYLALAWLANKLVEFGDAVEAGSVVLTGGLTRAYPLIPGQDMAAEFSVLGAVNLQLV